MESALILPDDLSERLEQHAIAIDSARVRGHAALIEICANLKAANDALANHGNGGFGKWVESRCGFTIRTANNYLRLVDAFASEVLESLSRTSTTEALYFLAKETTPEEAIDAAVELAGAGERITLSRAKKIVEELTVDGTAEVADEPDEDDSAQSDNGVQTDLDKLNDQIGKLIDRINGMVARNAMQHNAQSNALVAHLEKAKKLAKSMWRSWRNQ